MLRLNFQVNPAYLVYHFIKNTAATHFVSGECDPGIVAFQNAAWHKNKGANDFIRFGPGDDSFISGKSMQEIARQSDVLIDDMLQDVTFSPLLDETAKSLVLVRNEWESNYAKSNSLVAEWTGLDLDKEVNVYLTHPKVKQGHAGRGEIFWAYRLTWPNYNTVYLWHEYLHLAIPGGDLEHAVIQLIADNELRVQLNGGSSRSYSRIKKLPE